MPLLKENHEFWTRVKELAQKNIKSGAYEYFIDPAQLLSIENDTANILVESSFHKDYWRKQSDLISTAGFEVFGKPISYALFSKDELSSHELEALSDEFQEEKNLIQDK